MRNCCESASKAKTLSNLLKSALRRNESLEAEKEDLEQKQEQLVRVLKSKFNERKAKTTQKTSQR